MYAAMIRCLIYGSESVSDGHGHGMDFYFKFFNKIWVEFWIWILPCILWWIFQFLSKNLLELRSIHLVESLFVAEETNKKTEKIIFVACSHPTLSYNPVKLHSWSVLYWGFPRKKAKYSKMDRQFRRCCASIWVSTEPLAIWCQEMQYCWRYHKI